MQFSKVFAFTLLSGAMAAPLVASVQGAPEIVAAFNKINTDIATLDAGVAALAEGADIKAATADLTKKSQAIVADIKATTAASTASAALSLNDAVSVQQAAQKVTDATKKVVADFVSKKALIAKNGATATVLAELNSQKTAASDLVTAITAKVPANLQAAAKEIAGAVTDAIQSGITAFSS